MLFRADKALVGQRFARLLVTKTWQGERVFSVRWLGPSRHASFAQRAPHRELHAVQFCGHRTTRVERWSLFLLGTLLLGNVRYPNRQSSLALSFHFHFEEKESSLC